MFENPQFAGADTSYFIRQAVPLIGGGRVALATRNGVLNNLRSSKEQGQSNFTNPGVLMAGLGVDMDVLPTLRVSLNANSLYFDDTAVLEVEFRSGDLYRYFAVPPSVHQALIAADSPGAYFNRNISDRYPTRQQY